MSNLDAELLSLYRPSSDPRELGAMAHLLRDLLLEKRGVEPNAERLAEIVQAVTPEPKPIATSTPVSPAGPKPPIARPKKRPHQLNAEYQRRLTAAFADIMEVA